ncbi:rhodanese-like domain-containing protein [Aquibacillus sp. 3ASR75-11]|uniref:Rhodanese-like domain-containing protein n=1 Tax=Terrihalobacillus insolitus TaxID=2950438 RepID=A0A9X3WX96_9BACI|nr:rhodanese-like domain-containing protein [Terrihalobacillus insolitus]MDC3414994.1 rhodanese-like domain-containing protein [Terrihalobacillus insolitus]MDC3425871.1 rhodanese-like domain-containing protein [Terrihalobacillus insolitus]
MKEVTPEEVESYIQQGRPIMIVDVREDQEVNAGKIAEAIHIPLGSLESRMNELDKSKEHVFVCRSGRRSEIACDLLEDHGFSVSNMVGGMLEWEGKVE